jgi:chromosomal replication initiator protein
MQTKISPMIAPGLKTIEQHAEEIWELEPGKLSERTRRREVVEARQTVMDYRRTHRKESLQRIADRYYMDHATVIHASKTVSALLKTDKEFRRKHELFYERVT